MRGETNSRGVHTDQKKRNFWIEGSSNHSVFLNNGLHRWVIAV